MPGAKELLIRTNELVAELNHVPGFDPVKLLQGTLSSGKPAEGERIQLILKYKKLWFRLACPHGRIRVTALRLTEQMAIVQAEIFRDKDDGKPVSNFVASRTVHDTPGGLYIQAAEYEAVDNALTDAGFGIQLCDVCKAWGEEAYTPALVQRTDGVVSEETLPAEQKTGASVAPEGTVTAGLDERPDTAATAEPEPQSHEAPLALEVDGEPPAGEAVSGAAAEAPTSTAQAAESALEESEEDASSEGTASGAEDQQPANAVDAAAEAAAAGADATPESEDGTNGEMTLEEARNMIADVGSCRGKTLAQIADRRPTTLRWYFTTCPDSSEQLKRAARLVFKSLDLQRSA